ncbi:hypothetical protein HK096_009820, partial [Nowakowskiella sp. JEL0078]
MQNSTTISAGNKTFALRAKEKGNEQFSKGNHAAAILEYNTGLSYFRSNTSAFSSFTSSWGNFFNGTSSTNSIPDGNQSSQNITKIETRATNLENQLSGNNVDEDPL